MRLRADQEIAQNLKATLLDGKVVPMVYEADEEEGWVKSYLPKLPENAPTASSSGVEILEEDDGSRADMYLIQRHGDVELVWDTPPES